MMLFDSHTHYFDRRFTSEECPEGIDALLSRLFDGDLGRAINVGTDVATTRTAIAQARRYPGMYVAAGVHPSDAMRCPDMEAELSALRALLAEREENRIVALGEIGLDYHYPDTDRARQAAWFRAQMSMARELDMPVIIHDREAHGDCFDAVCEYPGLTGVFHSYSGSLELAGELIRRGWYISFSGTVTFKNAQRLAAVAAALPPDRVLVETDCPYLSPHPHRGELNHSGRLHLTVARLAELWGMPYERAAAITYENACRFYRLNEERL